jgi:hypothetical protein
LGWEAVVLLVGDGAVGAAHRAGAAVRLVVGLLWRWRAECWAGCLVDLSRGTCHAESSEDVFLGLVVD